MLKSVILVATIMIGSTLVFNSCQKENPILEEDPVISASNLKLLKENAFEKYQQHDFSNVVKPSTAKLDFEAVNKILTTKVYPVVTDLKDYETILGDHYNKQYFDQLSELMNYSEELIKSDLFNSSSTFEEREEFLEETLIYVFEKDLAAGIAVNAKNNCAGHRKVCNDAAERAHGIRLAGCAAAGVIGLLAGPVGPMVGITCAVGSGYLYDSDIMACDGHYRVCMGILDHD